MSESSATYKAALCHSIVRYVDQSCNDLFRKFGISSILDAVRIVCHYDTAFKRVFFEKMNEPLDTRVDEALDKLESLLLKDDTSISLDAFERIQRAISHITLTGDIPLLAPLKDVIDTQQLWNEKSASLLKFTTIDGELDGWMCALDKILELAVALTSKYSLLYVAGQQIPTEKPLR